MNEKIATDYQAYLEIKKLLIRYLDDCKKEVEKDMVHTTRRILDGCKRLTEFIAGVKEHNPGLIRGIRQLKMDVKNEKN